MSASSSRSCAVSTSGSTDPPQPHHRHHPDDPFAGIELVVFDKDGTLIDFDAMWSDWTVGLADRMAAASGRPVHEELYRALAYDPATGRAVAGGPLAAMLMAHARDLAVAVMADALGDRAAAEAVVAASWQAPDPLSRAHPLADLGRLFDRLHGRGMLVAVATSDDHGPTEATLTGLGLAGRVDAVVAADDGLAVKPAPDMLLHLCATLGVAPRATAVIGDSIVDLAMGRAAGARRCIGVLSGMASRAELAPLADLVVRSVADLLPDV